MAAADFTSYAAVLKRLYPQTDIQRILYENAPLYAMMPKKTDQYGETITIAMKVGNPQGRSAKFGNAKANKTPSTLKKVLISHASDYSLYSVDGKTIRVTSNSKGAIIKALEEEVDGAMESWKRSAAISVYREGGGAIGKVLTASGTTITLVNGNDIVNFEIGQVLNASTDNGSPATAGTRGPNLTMTVTGVVRTQGSESITVNAFIAGLAVSDFLFMDGDYGAKITGLAGWLPATDPTAGDSFFGLDRSSDPLRLAGVRVTATGKNPEEALQMGAQQCYRNGGRPNKCFMNDADFLNLQLSLGTSRTVLVQEQGAALGKITVGVSFDGIKVAGPAGPISVFPDPNCPSGIAYMLTMSSWYLGGAGDFPFVDATDGNKMLREDAADAYEGRIIGYYFMACDAPGWNARIAL